MNRIGRFVYRGQAELSAQFNKDILLRSRRRSAKARDAAEDSTEVIEPTAESHG